MFSLTIKITPAISQRSIGILYAFLAIDWVIHFVNNFQNNRNILVTETASNKSHFKANTPNTTDANAIAPSIATYPAHHLVASDVNDCNVNEDGSVSDEGEESKETDKKTKKSVVKSTTTTLYTAAKKKPSRRRKRDPNGMNAEFKFT